MTLEKSFIGQFCREMGRKASAVLTRLSSGGEQEERDLGHQGQGCPHGTRRKGEAGRSEQSC